DNPINLLRDLRRWLDHSPACVLTLANGTSSEGDQLQLEQLLRAAGLNVEFVGLTAGDNASYRKDTSIAVIANNAANSGGTPAVPADFRVIAFMAAYNEADIIVESIKKWTDQGVAVHVLENWSTDNTYDLVKQLESELPITVERFPATGPSPFFDWGAMLERIEQLSGEIT